MSAPRYRPPQRVFEALCRHYTRAEIADMCGVSPAAVSQWGTLYGCRPRCPTKPRELNAQQRLQKALTMGLHTHHAG